MKLERRIPRGKFRAFVVIVGAAFFFAHQGQGQVTPFLQSGAEHIAFEAENYQAIVDVAHFGKTWVPKTLAGASGGSALGANTDNTTAFYSYAAYSMIFDIAGTYNFYLRYASYDSTFSGAGNGDNDSFSLPASFNSTSFGAVSVGGFPWTWNQFGTYTVAPGDVGVVTVFNIGTREYGFAIDRLVFSKIGGLDAVALDGLANSPIPESSTYAVLFGLTALGFAAHRRRHRKSV